MEWMMEERRVRTSLKNVQIYSEIYFSYSIWKLGQDSSSRGLPGRITTNVRKKFIKTKIINNVLLGSLLMLMLILTLLLRVKESCPSHEVKFTKRKYKNMKLMTNRMMPSTSGCFSLIIVSIESCLLLWERPPGRF